MSNNVFSALSKKSAKKAAPLPAHAAPVLPKQMFSFPAASGSSWGDDEEVPQTTITSLTMPPTPAELADIAAANEADDEDSESESESEDEEETPVVKKEVAPAPIKKAEPVVQLSKKELKQKELDDLDAALAELGLAPAEKKEETTAKKSKKKKAKKPATAAAITAAPVTEKPQPVEETPAVVVDIKSVLAKKGGKKKKEESLAVKKAREEEAKKKAAAKSKKDRSTFNEFS
ncbi:hypothetical protein THRCLA_20641 [Thraustotheca clavata]|uniref:Uncharacterized protein n=1 Tax=Thraustotheca clavata TaxID=74557 RepID=A0A1W0A5P8_9STRA|nr:hypothetical protein THRCLA_20641 [Thraustotheca clavata]